MKTRAWTFRTVGYGHNPHEWGEMISALRMNGYDYVMSIEHEDPIMSIEEGFNKVCSKFKISQYYTTSTRFMVDVKCIIAQAVNLLIKLS